MHEMSLCESLVDVIEDAARRERFTRVRRIRLEVGRFAGVELSAMRFGFDAVTRGTVAEGAELEILEVPGAAWCFDCSDTVGLDGRLDPCPRCGGGRLQPSGGMEIRIRDMEVV
ncbi:hydrogenase maturation nickel metallochaperone HypA [Gluconacetobacter aggeris]|jgi:hydrogenase nickel incorporation protein HypA/HybF|uniref:Hydrogenase maturation factor HypA n=2 Tax=Gluconacetobacter aggeris TaxID=1286186 RepID=A0A7W4IS28_9PROT|nr:hydrogenase maturation nickel metallochaperone HypA [Gluconacetobacter aggeris]MBB2168010.1 hydrogenase maturation nickel metallochaperone HypA [Gluconacetobacter aggeris]